jgi:hypothetical protein
MERNSGQARRWDELATDWCPVARALSVIGDRLATIQRSVDAESSRMNELQQQLWRLDARIQLLERRERR